MGSDAIIGALLLALIVAIPVALWWLVLPRSLALVAIFATTVIVPIGKIVGSLAAWPPHDRTVHNVIDTFFTFESVGDVRGGLGLFV